ncbi:hypothetical protein G5C60_14120 [Streptomyces sp. HC44]|uniref:Uncharacterized protein n=1 Tax=Streptomyces scabichelini TaxID=2711217 RepID=A0A6G4V3Y5_9ACTN|nr:hypothetical protein [Streptomyces scabichelini]NGO08716.1 hypothetical protein [Streptomyces scabichelini]
MLHVTTTALEEAVRQEAVALLQAYRTRQRMPEATEPTEPELTESPTTGQQDGPVFPAPLHRALAPARDL